ncbi:hypothetical protein PENTCL1PPCAC_4308, partial [Pristionchus entomophagus]
MLGAHLVVRRQFYLNQSALGELKKCSFHWRLVEGTHWCPRIEVKPIRMICYRFTRLILQDCVLSPHGFVALAWVHVGVVHHFHCLVQ